MKLATFLLSFLLLFAPWLTASALADERKVIPSITVQQEYNDNLYFSSQIRDSDFITTVSPALELINNTERLQAGIKMQLNGVYYHKNQNLHSIDPDYSGTLRYAMSPRANLFTSAGYRRDLRVDRDFTQTEFLFGAVNRTRYIYRLGGDYALSEIMDGQLQYSFNGDYYEGSNYSDYKSQDISFLLSRDLSRIVPRTTGRMNLGITKFNTAGSEVTNYSGTIGTKRRLNEQISYFVDIGLRYTQSIANTISVANGNPYEEDADSSGLSGQAGVSYLNNVKLVFSHGVTATSGRSGTIERTAAQANVNRRLTGIIRVDCTVGYFMDKSMQDKLSALVIDERYLWFQPKIFYDFTNQIALETSYNYEMVNNSETNTDAYRNLVLLRLVFQHPLFK